MRTLLWFSHVSVPFASVRNVLSVSQNEEEMDKSHSQSLERVPCERERNLGGHMSLTL